jgi:hypothetical protein
VTPTVAPADVLDLRREALLMLDGRGAVLETAREVSRLLAPDDGGAVVGGVAVVLHGHVRTTVDVDVYLPGDPAPFAARLEAAGFTFDPARREFIREGIPVHRVRPEQVPDAPRAYVEVDGVRTVSLADLLAMKLRSGSRNVLRAQDLADVIGLIRRHSLGPDYAARLPKDLRPEFRKLARAVARDA